MGIADEELKTIAPSPRSHERGSSSEDDPLMRLFGSVHSPVTDVAGRHDELLGRELTTDHHCEQAGFERLLK